MTSGTEPLFSFLQSKVPSESCSWSKMTTYSCCKIPLVVCHSHNTVGLQTENDQKCFCCHCVWVEEFLSYMQSSCRFYAFFVVVVVVISWNVIGPLYVQYVIYGVKIIKQAISKYCDTRSWKILWCFSRTHIQIRIIPNNAVEISKKSFEVVLHLLPLSGHVPVIHSFVQH